MSLSFETLGNATIMMFEDGKPQFATDPWITGTAYYGSWALEKPLTAQQIENLKQCKYFWFSHGHPDHLHTESVNLLPRSCLLLVPDLYNSRIPEHLREMGFNVRVLKYREWFQVTSKIRICCLDNINQDAILAIDTDEGLIINKNDSPFCGEAGFLRSLVNKHPRNRTYMTSLYSGGGDMENRVNAQGERIIAPPQDYELGKALKVSREAASLGVGVYCCSSSQHVFARADSQWANAYGMDWTVLAKYWNRQDIRLVRPFVTVDMESGGITYNDLEPRKLPDASGMGEDDWNETLNETEWKQAVAFFKKFETLQDDVDIISITIGGVRTDIPMNVRAARIAPDKLRMVHFMAPKKSFMESITWGYFDDMMIGNFMKTELRNMSLYPDFTPKIGKMGGDPRVFTKQDLVKFRWHYFSRNPYAYLSMSLSQWFKNVIVNNLRVITDKIGMKPFFKWVYRRALLGDTMLGSHMVGSNTEQ